MNGGRRAPGPDGPGGVGGIGGFGGVGPEATAAAGSGEPGVNVVLNGEKVAFGRDATIVTALERLGCGTRGVAVAVNREVVVRSRWSATALCEGDEVEILGAVQGG